MELKLMELELSNFKGQAHFVFRPNGESCTIYGDNAAGKTTIYDALLWCLWGKDSKSRKDFDIKPLDADGNVKDRAAITSVTAVFAMDGRRITLQRTYYEKWSKKRGRSEATFDGHGSDFFVDEVPVKKNLFDAKVSELVDEDTFRLLTSVSYFPETMKWQERREKLFQIAGTDSDSEIMATDARFAPLAEAMDGRSLEDYKKMLESRRKGTVDRRKDIPARLDECQRTIDGLQGVDFQALRNQREAIAAREDQISQQLTACSAGNPTTELRAKATELSAKLRELEAENREYLASRHTSAENPAEVEALLDRAHRQLRAELAAAADIQGEIRDQEEVLESLRQNWRRIQSEGYTGSDSCPTCGQALPADKLREAKAAWAEKQQARLDMEEGTAKTVKQHLEYLNQRLAWHREAQEGIQAQVDQIQARLDAARTAARERPQNLPYYEERREKLERKRDELCAQVSRIERDAAAATAELTRQRESLRQEIARLDMSIAREGRLRDANRRMEELRSQAKAAAEEVEELDRMLFLCEEFSRYRAKYVEDSVNRLFRHASFRLFRELINGGLEECCDVVYQGVPYSSLNNGARINIGIDIIRTFSRETDTLVPLFVDNAESVTDLWQTGGQIIRLVVSEQDKELRVE